VTGQRVLVTGAASGLGEALTRAFRDRGDEVLATDVAGAGGFETGARAPSSTSGAAPSSTTDVAGAGGFETGARAPSSTTGAAGARAPSSTTDAAPSSTTDAAHSSTTRTLDITSDDDWAAALGWVEERWGGLDILVNNAGVAGGGRIDIAGIDEWQWIVDVNLLGAVRGCRTFTPMLKRQRSGRIVNVASLAGLVHPAGMASYNAVKAGVVALTETLGHELSVYGVTAHAVCPSYFRTNLLSSLRGADEALGAVVTELVQTSPFTADDIAAAVLAGLDAGDELILPDPMARAAYDLKLRDRPAYDAQMRRQAARLDELGRAAEASVSENGSAN
jgi:NAD(P)-dependent dehydrogenase (short-subunit alcohol dehydrogenase family)